MRLLLFWGCPAAIGGLVVAVIVGKTIKSFSGWPLAHVRQEILEFSPALTNANPAPASERNNGESPELLTNHINSLHTWILP